MTEKYHSIDDIINNIDVYSQGSVYNGLYELIKYIFLKFITRIKK
jgi:hypothetical protein